MSDDPRAPRVAETAAPAAVSVARGGRAPSCRPATGRLGAVLILALAALPVVAATGGAIEAPALSRSLVVDGDAADWAGVPAVPLGDDLGTLAATHHAGDLYLLLQLTSRSMAREVLESGLLLWFEGNGKARVGDEVFGVRYAGSPQLAADLQAGDRRAGGTPAASRDDAAGPPPQWRHHGGGPRVEPGELTVIRYGVKELKPEASLQGPAAASALHDGVFCYELRIPLADIGGKAAARPPTATRRVAIGLDVGGLTEAERDLREGSMARPGPPPGATRGGGFGGGGSLGGGTGGMGGMGHGGGHGQGPGEPSVHEPKIEWLKVTLLPGG